MRVNRANGERVTVGPMLREALRVAIDAARATGGLVDPTVGRALRVSGYDSTFRVVAARDGDRFHAEFCSVPGWETVELDEQAANGARACRSRARPGRDRESARLRPRRDRGRGRRRRGARGTRRRPGRCRRCARRRLAGANRRRSCGSTRHAWADGRTRDRWPRDIVDDRAPLAQWPGRAPPSRRPAHGPPRRVAVADRERRGSDLRRRERREYGFVLARRRTSLARGPTVAGAPRERRRSSARSSRAGRRTEHELEGALVRDAWHRCRLARLAHSDRRARRRRRDSLAEHALAALRRRGPSPQSQLARARLHRTARAHDRRRRLRTDLASECGHPVLLAVPAGLARSGRRRVRPPACPDDHELAARQDRLWQVASPALARVCVVADRARARARYRHRRAQSGGCRSSP